MHVDSRPKCLYRAETIGVYEPVVVVEHEGERETALAREPELADRNELLFVHSDCAGDSWRAISASG